ncbi:AraC family transcriptional regulator [Paenibacillus sp.]|uniref:helix-turn-helix transcriptional regulator n=1 Tax=Paenibacillus sp. TaxID=58172 RepID=UPI002D3AB364|nr:AraC family transcriptional regulator [Paenibacillus sp.]HZG84010.1 AraC family transcriptional regulator [Paenibacillus sp.]
MELAEQQNIRYAAADGSFRFSHVRDEKPNPLDYKPHYESGYEIYMFISGAGSFTIEGGRYELEPYSILMLNSSELHVVNISDRLPYERAVLTLTETLLPPFLLNGIDFYRSIKYRKPGHDNQIKAETAASAGLLDLFDTLRRHLTRRSAEDEFIAKCVIAQILHAINRISETERPAPAKKVHHQINEVLEYINSNLADNLDLDSLTRKFYINKYHLCRAFKEATGYSINQYIIYKRVRLADELMLRGHPPTQACFLSGFNSYSNFFRSYRKLTGRSPKTAKTR